MLHIPVAAIRISQKHLQDDGFDPGPVDGDLGQRTENALDRMLEARRGDLSPAHASDITGESRRRKLTAHIQLLAGDAGFDPGLVDGLWGPQTGHAFRELEFFEQQGQRPHLWRDFGGPAANPNGWPVEREAELVAHYGPPGDSRQVFVSAPYPLRLSWQPGTTVSRIRCHELVAESLERVLSGVRDHYGLDGVRALGLDLFGGCYNKRRIRGGTRWSTHAWGISLDFDTENNRLSWGWDRATFARPEYEEWWRLWEAEGWVSLGRVANFDWMHVQAARRST